ncbi:MAG TPA: DNA repair protein RecN [Trueperaceae bacterium]
MLRRLELRDFAIIQELSLELSAGLNVLTGETGAGKSIVVDALSLLAGARADVAFVRAGADDALVQGEFDGVVLQTAGRRVSASGRHAARLDGELVTVSELADRVGELVAVFAQHGALELQGAAAQRAQLDRLLSDQDRAALTEHRQAFARRGQVAARLEEVRAAMRERARRQDVLAYQLQEIEAAKVAPGEDDALESELATLRHAERIGQAASAAYVALAGEEPSATQLAADALRELRSAARHAPQLTALADDLETAVTGLSAVAAEVEAFLSGFDPDPGRLDAVQARLAKLDDLKRKYGDDLPAVVAFAERARRELAELEALDEDEAELEREEAQLAGRLAQLGAGLSAARRHAAQELAAQVTPLLARLGMPSAAFEVKVAPLEQPHASGSDDVTFLFGANPGEPLGPVSQIASGGELSRLMLALHLVTGAAQQTLAFDEVDAGVGGRAAREVGALLAELATGRQVLVVTHLAQVAAFADAHFVVTKTEQGGRTVTRVRRVQGDERAEELARMLSGTVTGASLEHARELVAAAPRPRAS